MLTRVFIGSVLVFGMLLVGMSLANQAPTKNCCAAGLACCTPASGCCSAETKLACCEKGMKCYAAKEGLLQCPAKDNAGKACCEQAKACWLGEWQVTVTDRDRC